MSKPAAKTPERLAGVRAWIGLKVRAERMAADMTQSALGEAVGLSVRSIANIEHGKHVALGALLRIADTFGLCIREFIPACANDVQATVREMPPPGPWWVEDQTQAIVYNPVAGTVTTGVMCVADDGRCMVITNGPGRKRT